MLIIVAMNAFKGCMGSIAAGESVARGLRKAAPQADIRVMGLADGGDGTLDVARQLMPGAEAIKEETLNALLEPVCSHWLYDRDSRTAFLEMARSAGLALLAGRRDVMHSSSYGFGMQIGQAIDAGARHLVIGLGGSATNDAGLGAMQALGLRVRLRSEGWISRPVAGGDLTEVEQLDASLLRKRIEGIRVTALFDAHIPLCGPMGAARLYSPQKGADPDMVDCLEKGLRNVEEIIRRCGALTPGDAAQGAGAAGGAGLACRCLLGAEMQAGAGYLLELQGLPRIAAIARGIITGEGASDAQTLQGKGPETVRRMAPDGVPVCLLSGRIDDTQMLLDAGFSRVIDINQEAPDPEVNPLFAEVAGRRLEAAALKLMKQGAFGTDRDIF